MTKNETNGGDAIAVTVEKLVYGGDGLSRLDGQVILTPFVLPGEQVKIGLDQRKSGMRRGRLRELVTGHPQRTEAPCPYFRRCGGCHYQHASYELQVEQKVEILRENLRRMGKINWTGPIGTVTGEPFGYRNRIQLHFERQRMGYRAAHSHELVPIKQCPISSPALNTVIGELSQMVGDPRWPRFLRELELFTDEQALQLNVVSSDQPVARRFFDWCRERLPGVAGGPLHYAVNGDVLQVDRRSFFQVNRFLVPRLAELAIGESAGERALDLYAGVGLFSLPLARRFGQVDAVESGQSATHDLQANALRAEVRVGSHTADVAAFLAGQQEGPDLLLADPPRAGLDKEVTEQILRLAPRQVVIVSCDPATLARDLASLVPAYAIEKLTLVDLFPQTYHLETIVHLSRA